MHLKMTESGERIIPGSRRPDGTLRKEIRVRPGYVPLEEQAVYVSRGAKVILHFVPNPTAGCNKRVSFAIINQAGCCSRGARRADSMP